MLDKITSDTQVSESEEEPNTDGEIDFKAIFEGPATDDMSLDDLFPGGDGIEFEDDD